MKFIPPCLPTLRKEPPSGLGWLHEVKFDGFRIQIHKDGRNVVLFSKKATISHPGTRTLSLLLRR
jgi:bifunctional non-homologous end joining protein LigD